MRHKRRSVLETAAHGTAGRGRPRSCSLDCRARRRSPTSARSPATSSSSRPPARRPPIDGAGVPGGLGALHLAGRLADGVSWTLGGLVAENEGRALAHRRPVRDRAWRRPQHRGGRRLRRRRRADAASRGPAAARAGDGRRVPHGPLAGQRRASRPPLGARYTYIGFLPAAHHPDAVVELELQGDPHTVLRGSILTRTLRAGRRPADAVDRRRFARDHLGAARRRPARRRGRCTAMSASSGAWAPPSVGAQLFDERTSRRAAHLVQRHDAARAQRRQPAGARLRRAGRPPRRAR